jgi:class 3 adenylate cyclase
MLTDQSTVDVIKKSRKLITILFSDIEESTRHWERRGDIEARILISRHNQLLFPAIRKYNGKIIKTLGDSIMASFDDADNAVKAGIAIHQILITERKKDKYFSLRARIGIHTGKGLVEEDDIFGDVVNVAAKAEAEAEGNQILLTTGTKARLKSDQFTLTEAGELHPRGKRKPTQLLECDWQHHESLIKGIKPDALMPLVKRQKLEILSYVMVSLLALFYMYHKYFRYILADNNLSLAGIMNINYLPSDYPPFIALIGFCALMMLIYLLKIDFISRSMLKIISGLFGFGLIFFVFHGINNSVDFPFNKRWYENIYQSDRLFVEVITDKAQLKDQPNHSSKSYGLLPKGELFIYQQSKQHNGVRWDKVKISNEKYAWIARKILPAFGVAEQQITKTQRFSLHHYDLYGLILAVFGFIWGFLSFNIRPN